MVKPLDHGGGSWAMVEAAGPEPPLSEVTLLAVCLVAFAGFCVAMS